MGQTLGELLGWPIKLSHREYLTWLAWTQDEWNQPNRTDYYLMQLTMVLKQKFARNPSIFNLNDQRIEFEPEAARPINQPADIKRTTEATKSRWRFWTRMKKQ